MAKDKLDPSATSAAYDKMQPRWQMIDTLLGGTESMREAGGAYLPKHRAETPEDYEERLSTNTLENFLEQTLEHLTSKPFAEAIKVKEDVPKDIIDRVLPDVDLQGNDLDVFCRAWFRTGLAKGVGAILVDHPRRKDRPDGKERTLDDDRRENLRPYWSHIDPSNIIFAYGEVVDGVETLLHVRIKETVQELDGYQTKDITQIRVLEPGKVTLLRESQSRKKGRDKWVKFDEWNTGLKVIPLVLFYTAREDVMQCKPPLMDLAYMNVAHWQSTADQRHVMKVARFPMLALSGGEDDGQVKVGPNQLLHCSDPQGKWYYVEHTGAAIEAGRNELRDLGDAMRAYGAEFLKTKPGTETATARALDGAEAVSALQAYTMMFMDAVAQALDLTAMWLRIEGGVGGTVEMTTDFGGDEAEFDVKPLMELRSKRDLSRETLLELLILRGLLPEDFDVAQEINRLNDEAELAASLDIDPAAPDDDGDGKQDDE